MTSIIQRGSSCVTRIRLTRCCLHDGTDFQPNVSLEISKTTDSTSLLTCILNQFVEIGQVVLPRCMCIVQVCLKSHRGCLRANHRVCVETNSPSGVEGHQIRSCLHHRTNVNSNYSHDIKHRKAYTTRSIVSDSRNESVSYRATVSHWSGWLDLLV